MVNIHFFCLFLCFCVFDELFCTHCVRKFISDSGVNFKKVQMIFVLRERLIYFKMGTEFPANKNPIISASDLCCGEKHLTQMKVEIEAEFPETKTQ